MLQKLSITLANVKADKTFENLQNEIYHIIYSLYLSKNITKKVVELSYLRIKITQKHKKKKKVKKSYKSNKFKLSEPTLDEEFKLLRGSFSVSDIQDYFECIIKKLETLTDNTPVQIYINMIENRVTLSKIRILS